MRLFHLFPLPVSLPTFHTFQLQWPHQIYEHADTYLILTPSETSLTACTSAWRRIYVSEFSSPNQKTIAYSLNSTIVLVCIMVASVLIRVMFFLRRQSSIGNYVSNGSQSFKDDETQHEKSLEKIRTLCICKASEKYCTLVIAGWLPEFCFG